MTLVKCEIHKISYNSDNNGKCMICHPKSEIIKIPFSEEQIKNLDNRQLCGVLHEYTCSCSSILIPKPDGWWCFVCKKIVQEWAYKSDCDGTNVAIAEKLFSDIKINGEL
jgi:hypothetical protein